MTSSASHTTTVGLEPTLRSPTSCRLPASRLRALAVPSVAPYRTKRCALLAFCSRALRWLVRFFAKKNNLPFWTVVFHYFSRLSDLNQPLRSPTSCRLPTSHLRALTVPSMAPFHQKRCALLAFLVRALRWLVQRV